MIRFLSASALVLAGIGAAGATGTPGAPPSAERVPDAPGKARWEPTYAKARERAQSEGRFVFVEFGEAACGNCARMDQLLYPAVNFEMMLLRMVPVKLDRTGAEGAALAERYGITESPAALVVSAGGALVFRVNGFDDANDFYRHVSESVAEWDKLNVRLIHGGGDDPKEELALGTALALRFDPEEAAPRFARAAASEKADPGTRDLARTYLAAAQFRMKRYEDSGKTIEEILRTSKDPRVREQAELFRGQLAVAEGRREDARRTILAFLREHPDSALAGNARQMLTSIPADSVR
ncbi:MAG TPA: thioredoxin family protein [Thermoanaerobaculia bacterium]|nr:thioredoxin family protein [Thermoanaerobaculia bacterium]